MFRVKPHHAPQIDGADDIHVVQNERLLQTRSESRKKWAAFFKPPPVSSRISSRETSILHAEIVVGFQIIDNHVREVMRIDNHLAHAKGAQAGEGDLQQRTAGNFTSALGRSSVSGRRRVPRPAARIMAFIDFCRIFSSPICRTTTSTPPLPRKCFANCSARYTERCWPPVQPNDTIRLLKPRR